MHWNKLRPELLKPITAISGSRIFHALLNDRMVMIGQLYLTSADRLLEIPQINKPSLATINKYLNGRGLAGISTEDHSIEIDEFSVPSAKLPDLRPATMKEEVEQFLHSDSFKELKAEFSQFASKNKPYFFEMAGVQQTWAEPVVSGP